MGADFTDSLLLLSHVHRPQISYISKHSLEKTIAGDEQQDRIMSESKTAANSNLSKGKELIVNLRQDCQTQHLKTVSAEEVHADSDQPGKIRSVPIHQRPDLLTPCADLINSEWQRSQGARVHYLQKSCPEFPMSLVLLQGHKETEKLLGHVRISRVVGHGSSLFLESVVVSKMERGKGYGRILMTETERYARSRGFRRLCLTTHDKQHFYAHLGFVRSTPVQNAGSMSTFVPMEMLLKFSRLPSEDTHMRTQAQIKMDTQGPQGSTDQMSASQPCSLPPPPPTSTSMLPSPPPPPPTSTSILPSPPPPPPPPPPTSTPILPSPPPPPPISTSILPSPPPPPPPPTSTPILPSPPPPPPPPISTSILPSPPPPPPPPPPTFTSILPSPPPPPPISTSILPSPPLPPSPSPVVQTLTETPYRNAKGLPIFWLHKDI